MKNKTKLFLLIVFFAFLISISNVCYGKSYTIDNIDMQATINQDGSVNVKQEMTYTFKGEYNGIYITIPHNLNEEEYDSCREQGKLKDNLYNNSGVSINRISLDKTSFVNDDYASNGAKNVYKLENDQEVMKVKVFSPSVNETKTFKLDYTLNNLCVKHNDVGELYYNFIGGQWDVTIKNLNIDVYLDDSNKDLKIWGHGNYNGISKILSKSHASFTTYDVRPGEYVGVRMLFDRDIINNSHKLSNLTATDLVMEDEENVGQNIQAKKDRISTTIKICIVLFIYWVVLLFKYERDKKNYFTDIGEEELFKKYNPLIAGCIQGSRDILARDIIAVILNLINKKIVELDIIPFTSNTNKLTYTYKIAKKPDKEAEMDKIERFIYNWVFKNEDKINLADRLEKLPRDIDASEKFAQLDVLARTSLNEIGANENKVPKILQIFNNIILIASLIWGMVSIQELMFNIFNKNEILGTVVSELYFVGIIVVALFPFIYACLYLILRIIFGIRRIIIKGVQKYSGQRIISTSLTILVFTILIIIGTYYFSSVRGLVFDEMLISIALLICLTDNLMLKNSNLIIKDYCKLNNLKEKIDFSLMDERDIEHIELWDEYLAYAVSFGNAAIIMKRIKIMTTDECIMKLMEDSMINRYVYDDYKTFYDETSLDSRFLRNYRRNLGTVTKAWAKSAVSGGNGSHGGSGGGFSGGGGFSRRRWTRWRPEALFKPLALCYKYNQKFF